MQVTGTLKAWTTSKWRNIEHVEQMIKAGRPDEALAAMHFIDHDMSDTDEWTEVGTAEVVVTFHPREAVVAKELEGLQAQLQKVRAENQYRENAILDRISNLQALTYESGEVQS
jgi:UDP-N-acetylglucosamine 2-epimerase